jgi:hypothetical protein
LTGQTLAHKRLRTFHDPKNTPPFVTHLTEAKSEVTISECFRALEPADLAIEIPDFYIAAVHKLASDRQRLRVCNGVDWFE